MRWRVSSAKETAGRRVERMFCMQREDTEHSVFTIGQLGWNVELGVGPGPDFKGIRLKQFSTSHESHKSRKGSTNAYTQ